MSNEGAMTIVCSLNGIESPDVNAAKIMQAAVTIGTSLGFECDYAQTEGNEHGFSVRALVRAKGTPKEAPTDPNARGGKEWLDRWMNETRRWIDAGGEGTPPEPPDDGHPDSVADQDDPDSLSGSEPPIDSASAAGRIVSQVCQDLGIVGDKLDSIEADVDAGENRATVHVYCNGAGLVSPETINRYARASERPSCEVCGQPATNGVRDMREVLTGTPNIVREPAGPPVWFCDEHRREPCVLNQTWGY